MTAAHMIPIFLTGQPPGITLSRRGGYSVEGLHQADASLPASLLQGGGSSLPSLMR
jgi:hypothetical protein